MKLRLIYVIFFFLLTGFSLYSQDTQRYRNWYVQSGHSKKGLALLLANDKYLYNASLQFAVSGTKLFEEALKELGFDIEIGYNLDQSEMLDVIASFKNRIKDYESVFVYYAGHGVQFGGENYIVPSDARGNDATTLKARSIRLNDILLTLDVPQKPKIIILDACRENPFMKNMTAADRAIGGQGLAEVKALANSLTIFSTSANTVVSDDNPFTRIFSNRLKRGGCISEILIDTRNDVASNDRSQIVWESGSLMKQFCFGDQKSIVKGTGNRPIAEPAQYIKLYEENEFYDGLTRFDRDGKYGFADTSGRVIIKPRFDFAFNFSDGMALVNLNRSSYFINKAGDVAINLGFDEVISFFEGMAKVKQGNKYGFINKEGKLIIGLKYDDAGSFLDGLCRVKVGDNWGYIDKEGREVIEPKYSKAWGFFEGLASVQLNGKWAVINKKGEAVTDFKFSQLGSFANGYCLAEFNKKWGFIDKEGREAIPFKYGNAWNLEGGAILVEDENRAGLLNRKKNEVIYFDKGGFAASSLGVSLSKNGKFGLVDSNGIEIVPFKYDATILAEKCGWFRVQLNNKEGFVDKKGEEVIPLVYDDLSPFGYELAAAKRNGKYGFIDKRNRTVISFRYDYAQLFFDGMAVVGLSNKYGYIDITGKEITPLEFDEADIFRNGLAKVKQGGKWGLINKLGQVAIPFQYDEVERVDGFKVFAKVKTGQESFYIDRYGNRLPD